MNLKEVIAVTISAINPISQEYDYGDLIFPATTLEIEDAFQKSKVTLGGKSFVEIVSSPLLPRLCEIRIDGPIEPKEMNLLAMRLQNLLEDELLALGGLLISKVPNTETDTISVEELINMTYFLKDVIVVHDIRNVRELGAFAIKDGLAETYGLSKDAIDCADLGAVGEKQKKMDNGQFYNGAYIVTAGYEIPKEYKTPSKEQLEIKNDYAFALKIAQSPLIDDEVGEESAEWIYLPIDKTVANEIAATHDEKCVEDCVFYDFKSVFKSIEPDILDDMMYFDKLNEIAAKYAKFDNLKRIKFKAVVEKEQPETLDEMLEISNNLSRYEFTWYDTTDKQFAKSYLAYNLPTNFDTSFLDDLPLWEIGEKIIKRVGTSVTDYGAVSEKDKGLYDIITPQEQLQEELNIQEQDEGIGGMMM